MKVQILKVHLFPIKLYEKNLKHTHTHTHTYKIKPNVSHKNAGFTTQRHIVCIHRLIQNYVCKAWRSSRGTTASLYENRRSLEYHSYPLSTNALGALYCHCQWVTFPPEHLCSSDTKVSIFLRHREGFGAR